MTGSNSDPETKSNQPPDWLIEIWYSMTSRIAPELCCSRPSPPDLLFKEALRETAQKNGDLDKAIEILNDILTSAPSEWMVFQQAGQLLNIIGWRREFHPDWFILGRSVIRMHPGRCGRHVAHAIALMQAQADEEALSLTEKIIADGTPGSDDVRMCRLIRAAIHICNGDGEEGEKELYLLSNH